MIFLKSKIIYLSDQNFPSLPPINDRREISSKFECNFAESNLKPFLLILEIKYFVILGWLMIYSTLILSIFKDKDISTYNIGIKRIDFY